jgi:cardiolipin synthase A/B
VLTAVIYVAAIALVAAVAGFVYFTASVNAEADRQDDVVSIVSILDSPTEFLRAFAAAVGGDVIDGNRVTVYQNGDEIFPPLLSAIGKASSSVHFATFVYTAGRIPTVFADAFSAAARRGVEVRIALDREGAAKIPRDLISQMRAAGCDVRWFGAAQWFDWERYNHRSHRKLLIIDGETAFTGGVGVADEWLGNGDSPTHWRDTHIRIEGPAVAALQAVFIDTWNDATGQLPLGRQYFPKLGVCGATPVCVIQSNPVSGTSPAQRGVAALIAAAKRTLWITNAYFIPSPPLVRALCDARARGVDVRVLVPGPYHNKPTVRRASRTTWSRLISGGVQLYEHQLTMVHAKVIVADGLISMVGSINFDPRSFSLNSECSAVCLDAELANSLARSFENDMSHSRPVTAPDIERLPSTARFLDAILYWLRAQL